MEQTTSALRINHVLKGTAYTYSIESVLGQGSFGITYLATTTISVPGPLGTIDTRIQVAVKEFYMHEFCSRHEDGTIAEMTQGTLVANYARKFRKEAENLAKLSHPNIVKVLEVFDANNTTYYAMEYIPGGSLDAYVKQQGGLPEEEAIACIRQIGSALGYMHDHKMLHLDLKPSNVMRSADGSRLTLIDFGLSKQYEENGNPESSTSIGLGTPGYAPIEQSSSDRDRDFAPTLDVYALGATFFKLLTGQTPPQASTVLDEGLPMVILLQKDVSRQSLTALERAMEPRKSKRLKTVDELMSLLSGNGADCIEEERTDFSSIRIDSSSIILEEGSKKVLNLLGETKTKPVWRSSVSEVATVDFLGCVRALKAGKTVITAICGCSKAECRVEVIPQKGQEKLQEKPKPYITLSNPLSAVKVTAIAVCAFVLLFFGVRAFNGGINHSEFSSPEVSASADSTASAKPATIVSEVSSDKNQREAEAIAQSSPAVIPLESVSLNKSSLTLEEGQSVSLKVKYVPSDATDKTTKWKSTNTEIVTVNSKGKVMALKAGSAAIVMTCSDKEAYCNVTVSPMPVPNKDSEPIESQSQTVSPVQPHEAASSKPAVTSTSMKLKSGSNNGHDYVDLGLPSGLLWATCNVGAYKPSEYGAYFAWGETSVKQQYFMHNLKYLDYDWKKGRHSYSKYNRTERGTKDNIKNLEYVDDAARNIWGNVWRTPTQAECNELILNCDSKWTSFNGVVGCLFTSKNNGNQVFFPAAGHRNDKELFPSAGQQEPPVLVGDVGEYWTASLLYDNSSEALCLSLGNSATQCIGFLFRYYGLPVRPVFSR